MALINRLNAITTISHENPTIHHNPTHSGYHLNINNNKNIVRTGTRAGKRGREDWRARKRENRRKRTQETS